MNDCFEVVKDWQHDSEGELEKREERKERGRGRREREKLRERENKKVGGKQRIIEDVKGSERERKKLQSVGE